MILVMMNFFGGAGVQETFQKLLSLAVVLQLVPFLYMFGALLKMALERRICARTVQQGDADFCGSQRVGDYHSWNWSGIFSGAADYFAAGLTKSGWCAARCFLSDLAAFFFFVYGRRKAARKTGGYVRKFDSSADSAFGGEYVPGGATDRSS